MFDVRRRWLPDYTRFFEIFSCQVRVQFTKIGMKNSNSNAVLPKNKYDKVLKNRKSLGFLLHEPGPDITCSFANKDDKIVKPPKCGVGLSSSIYISIQAKARLKRICFYVSMGLAYHFSLNANFAERWYLVRRFDSFYTYNHSGQLFNWCFV